MAGREQPVRNLIGTAIEVRGRQAFAVVFGQVASVGAHGHLGGIDGDATLGGLSKAITQVTAKVTKKGDA